MYFTFLLLSLFFNYFLFETFFFSVFFWKHWLPPILISSFTISVLSRYLNFLGVFIREQSRWTYVPLSNFLSALHPIVDLYIASIYVHTCICFEFSSDILDEQVLIWSVPDELMPIKRLGGGDKSILKPWNMFSVWEGVKSWTQSRRGLSWVFVFMKFGASWEWKFLIIWNNFLPNIWPCKNMLMA